MPRIWWRRSLRERSTITERKLGSPPNPFYPPIDKSSTSDFSGLVLEITTTKDAFVQLEPVPLALTLTNKTNQTILGHNALNFSLGFTDLFVYHNGEGRQIVNLSPIRGSATVKPRQIQPRESYGSRELLVLDLDKVFPMKYRLSFMTSNGRKRSDPIAWPFE